MSLFNKEGVEFTHLVCIDRDPTVDPTYSHKFPAFDQKRQRIVERWSTKVRPIRSLTEALRGVRLMRKKDYMIDYNPATQQYEYWFKDAQPAVLFALVCSTMKQTVSQPGHQFDIVCPHCAGQFPQKDIAWR